MNKRRDTSVGSTIRSVRLFSCLASLSHSLAYSSARCSTSLGWNRRRKWGRRGKDCTTNQSQISEEKATVRSRARLNGMSTCATLHARKSEVHEDDYPGCYSEMTDGRPAYLCERTVDGEKQKFGIKFWEKKFFTCGGFQGDEPNGPAYKFLLDGSHQQQSLRATFANGTLEGPISWYFFETRNMEMGIEAVRGKFQPIGKHRSLLLFLDRRTGWCQLGLQFGKRCTDQILV